MRNTQGLRFISYRASIVYQARFNMRAIGGRAAGLLLIRRAAAPRFLKRSMCAYIGILGAEDPE